MNKVLDFFKKIPNAYYGWKKRNENLSLFLEESKNNKDKLNHIDANVADLKDSVIHIKEEISTLKTQVDQINEKVETVEKGTKIELLATLYNWRTALVLEQGWASPAEKKEVERIYHIYHDKLMGNGQGERYYNEIIMLPESEKEKNKLLEGKNNGKS